MVVSEKRSFLWMTAHGFEVKEGGQQVTYEVNVLSGFGYGYLVRRNGILVASQPWLAAGAQPSEAPGVPGRQGFPAKRR